MNDKKENKKIEKDVNLAELVQKYPQTVEVLMDYGMHCVGCIASAFDSLEMGAKAHKMTDADIEELLVRINEVVSFKE